MPKPNKLLVAPFNLRFRIVSLINREIRFAKSGVKAEIMMKMNNLVTRNCNEIISSKSIRC
ncbi:MAG: hypothetical protein IPN09_14855 [Bacteroidetes bacterium]|nr:hypothetical protein [Bacteroidota bacterium]